MNILQIVMYVIFLMGFSAFLSAGLMAGSVVILHLMKRIGILPSE